MARSAAVDSVFQAIACPTRRAILDAVALGESNVSDLVASLAVTQSAVSQQLAILKSAGLVEERADGRFRYYRLRAKPLTEIDAWLGRYRAHMDRQLDALGRVLDAMPDDPKHPPPPRPRPKGGHDRDLLRRRPNDDAHQRCLHERHPHCPRVSAPADEVWRALTEPALMALWSMRPQGFAPLVGTRFKFIAKPNPGWRGFVECEVLEAREPSVLRYSWVGDDSGRATEVTFRLEPHGAGTRLVFEHAGFRGVGGFLLAKLMMGPGWKKMLSASFPAVLADIDEDGGLRSGSPLKPKF